MRWQEVSSISNAVSWKQRVSIFGDSEPLFIIADHVRLIIVSRFDRNSQKLKIISEKIRKVNKKVGIKEKIFAYLLGNTLSRAKNLVSFCSPSTS